jgi:hypothetical protein
MAHSAVHYRSVQRVKFLRIRWLGVEPGYRSGTRYARLSIHGPNALAPQLLRLYSVY